MIKGEGLSYTYEGSSSYTIDNIYFHISPGEFVAILGHNGSGKSTLARLINGLLIPTKGRLFVQNMAVTEDQSVLWKIRQNVGIIFQNPDNQLVATVVEEEIAFGPENLGLPPAEIRQRVDYALQSVGMEDFKKKSPAFLSGGQKQKIAIAGILAMQPSCIVLDEPTAMLDPKDRKDFLNTVKRLKNEHNITILYITHFMEEAASADRIIVLNEGRIAVTGTPREVFSQVKYLKKLQLDVPRVTELSHRLRASGFKLPHDILTIYEMADHLCP
jgi:energy-coupling factor transport system ATP-binding protein